MRINYFINILNRLTGIIGLLLFSLSIQAQRHLFGVIQDADGCTNVRNENRKIVDKLYENHVFYIWSIANDDLDATWKPAQTDSDAVWILIEYPPATGITKEQGDYENVKEGYIHKSRIKYLEDLPQLKKSPSSTGKRIIFSNDTLSVEIKTQNFNPKAHRIVVDRKYSQGCSIDGATDIWGAYYPEVPAKEEYASIRIKHPKGVLEFPKEYLQHLYQPCDYPVVVLGTDNTIFIQTWGGDGSEGHFVVWTIKDYEVKSLFVGRGF